MLPERDVLFEFGGARDPPAELLREDQGVISQPERVLGDVGGCRGSGIRPGELVGEPEFVDGDVAVRVAHRCGTPSEAV